MHFFFVSVVVVVSFSIAIAPAALPSSARIAKLTEKMEKKFMLNKFLWLKNSLCPCLPIVCMHEYMRLVKRINTHTHTHRTKMARGKCLEWHAFYL